MLPRISVLAAVLTTTWASASNPSQHPFKPVPNPPISHQLFAELEELSRLVDIAYCVGDHGIGIRKPFKCLGRCDEFPNFELISTFKTGVLLSDSCGYIAFSHPPSPPRIVLAFRGTYSIANTIADLFTVPQEYIPYPGEDPSTTYALAESPKCVNCTVHTGFYTSWRHTRDTMIPALESAIHSYPSYQLVVIGHSLGGAVAALASLEFLARGWNPVVTTFGEPKVGNAALAEYLDAAFVVDDESNNQAKVYRRVTHIGDPVPLLPLAEWGYAPHGGEIFITRPELPPTTEDIIYCNGIADKNCIAGGDKSLNTVVMPLQTPGQQYKDLTWWRRWWALLKSNRSALPRGPSNVPPEFRLWELFFAHRDYFWRLGVCLPGR